MTTRERVLRQRCAKFAALISSLNLNALTPWQRQVSELRIAGLSLQLSARLLELAQSGSGRLRRAYERGRGYSKVEFFSAPSSLDFQELLDLPADVGRFDLGPLHRLGHLPVA